MWDMWTIRVSSSLDQTSARRLCKLFMPSSFAFPCRDCHRHKEEGGEQPVAQHTCDVIWVVHPLFLHGQADPRALHASAGNNLTNISLCAGVLGIEEARVQPRSRADGPQLAGQAEIYDGG